MRHQCLAAFIVFVLYLTISTFLGLVEIKTLTHPETITKTLNEANFYQNLPKLIEDNLVNNPKNDPQTKALLTGIMQSIDPKTVKTEVEKNASPFFDYLLGRTPILNVSFDLRDFKQNLKTKLPDILSQEQNIQNANSTDELLKTIPDTYNLSQVKDIDKTFANAKLAFKILNILYLASIILSLILIGLLALLGRGYWPSIPRWIGLSLILPAGSFLIFDLFAKALPQILMGQYSKGIDPEIVKLINPLILSLSKNTLTISFLYSGIFFGLGFVLILLSYILPHPPEPKPVAKTPSPQPSPQKP